MNRRHRHSEALTGLLAEFPVVGLVGARQVGKTTLARALASDWPGPVTLFDLEDPRARARLADPMLALEPLAGLIVIDEVHHQPDLFSVLRVLADRPSVPARFLVLGSASPELLRQGAESLAGRIAFHELTGFNQTEVGHDELDRLWSRGGFPRSFLAKGDRSSLRWRQAFVKTFLERDLVDLEMRLPAETMRRFWMMIAHDHGQHWNSSEFARSLGVSQRTVGRYLDTLCSTFMVRRLQPFHVNLGKRQVKAPKVYVSDTGLLHALLGLNDLDDLLGHPKCGASWEGFALGEVAAALDLRPEDCSFWALHGGAELDLLVVRGNRRLGFEFKRDSSPTVTRSMHSALATLDLEQIVVVYPGAEAFPMAQGVRALPLKDVPAALHPLD